MGSPSSRNGLSYHLPLGEGHCRGCSKEACDTRPAKQQLKHASIAEITLSLNFASASLAVTRFLLVFLGGYAGVFRISEVLSIRVRDVSIFDEGLISHYAYVMALTANPTSTSFGGSKLSSFSGSILTNFAEEDAVSMTSFLTNFDMALRTM